MEQWSLCCSLRILSNPLIYLSGVEEAFKRFYGSIVINAQLSEIAPLSVKEVRLILEWEKTKKLITNWANF